LQDLPPWIAAAQRIATIPGACPFPRIRTSFATGRAMRGTGKRFAYFIRSQREPVRDDVGITSDPDRCLEWHSDDYCGHTTRHRPWSFVVVLEFSAERSGVAVGRYLKSGSGRAFAKRHRAAR
jgi:hypothetical protein